MSIAYGIHSVIEALNAGGVEKVCIERGQKNPRIREIVDLSRQKKIPVSIEERAWLDRRAAGERHQGVVCYISEMPTLGVEEILAQAHAPGLLLVLDGIEDPHNLGAILRSAEVAGAHGVFIPQRRSAPLSAAAIKASAGAASYLKVARVANTVRLLEQLKAAGYWIAGFDAESGRPMWEIDFTVPTALVLGSEGSGLHRLVKEKCDFLASIPMRGNVASYNVSVSAGIALYEVIRQRSKK
ncbi:MAG: 23S rRNA (guanosine(2251)-2'-O)-methyltransferase RlmB [Acidobacteriia bacterium]|nr:23S rRNA (guanosine(2251)-2'-O)-methyltransferase RlmB [Terriglobia bacterium]